MTRDEIIQAIDVARKKFLATGRDRPSGAWLGDAADAIRALSPPEPTEGQVADEAMLVAIRAAFDSDNVAAKNIQLRLAFDYIRKQQAALRSMPLQEHTNGWQDISTNQKDGDDVIVWTSEGLDIARYSDVEHDGPDSMGHDAGWWGLNTPMDPGRHMGNPAYFREPVCQPTHWLPIEPPASPDEDDEDAAMVAEDGAKQ